MKKTKRNKKTNPSLTYFVSRSDELIKLFLSMGREWKERDGDTLPQEERMKIYTKYISQIEPRRLGKNRAIALNKKLKKFLTKKWEVATLPEIEKDRASYRNCAVCGMFMRKSRNGQKKCCGAGCRAIFLKRKRDVKSGNTRDIVRHKTCLVCGKSLAGKRLDAKTCSPCCRKKLQIKR